MSYFRLNMFLWAQISYVFDLWHWFHFGLLILFWTQRFSPSNEELFN